MRGDPTTTLGILVAGLIGVEAEHRVPGAAAEPLGWPLGSVRIGGASSALNDDSSGELYAPFALELG
ncbi:MAG: hypothetical protein KIT72_14990 [Polyangiaceae bacterium]|nr:hypothetical protein [Polyangiaceae bacterium]MCW5791722.1 hypothetical protein [Polyangiaceae bacterium]